MLTIPPSCDARPLVYHSNHHALSTARFRRAGLLATTDTRSTQPCILRIVSYRIVSYMRAGARAVVSRRGVRDSASLRLGVVRPAADRRGAVRHGEHLQHPQTHPLLHHQLAPRSAAADARPPGQRRSVVCRSVCLSDTLASAAQKRMNRSRSRSAAWSTTCCASWSWRWSSASRSRPASTSSTGSGEPSRRGRERSAGLET